MAPPDISSRHMPAMTSPIEADGLRQLFSQGHARVAKRVIIRVTSLLRRMDTFGYGAAGAVRAHMLTRVLQAPLCQHQFRRSSEAQSSIALPLWQAQHHTVTPRNSQSSPPRALTAVPDNSVAAARLASGSTLAVAPGSVWPRARLDQELQPLGEAFLLLLFGRLASTGYAGPGIVIHPLKAALLQPEAHL